MRRPTGLEVFMLLIAVAFIAVGAIQVVFPRPFAVNLGGQGIKNAGANGGYLLNKNEARVFGGLAVLFGVGLARFAWPRG